MVEVVGAFGRLGVYPEFFFSSGLSILPGLR